VCDNECITDFNLACIEPVGLFDTLYLQFKHYMHAITHVLKLSVNANKLAMSYWCAFKSC